MRKKLKKLVNFLLVVLLVITTLPVSSLKAEAFAVSRDDGTWLFPLPSNYYNSFTDWAGCPGYSKCVFCGVSHPAWGDNAHTGQGGHNGFDVGAPAGTNVYAAAAGKAYTFFNSARGNTIVIEHAIGNGYSYYSYYQHLSSFNISNGQSVSTGAVIGKVGSTGASSGAHLHFGIVMGKSGQAGTANLLNSLESAGWITSAGYRNGRILNNPASSNDAGFPKGYSAVVAPLKAHYGSTHYTFNAAKVTVGIPAEHKHNWQYLYFGKTHPHINYYKCTICGEEMADYNSSNYWDQCLECQRPAKVTVTLGVTLVLEGGALSVRHSSAERATHYNLCIRKKGKNGTYEVYRYEKYISDPSVPILLEPGEYSAQVIAYNSNKWESDGSDWLHNAGDEVFFKVVKLGDANEDGEITAGDALAILKKMAGIEQNSFYAAAANVNRIGGISTDDALRILKFLAGLEKI